MLLFHIYIISKQEILTVEFKQSDTNKGKTMCDGTTNIEFNAWQKKHC